MLDIIIPEALDDIVPAAARLALQRNNLDVSWLFNEFIRHRAMFPDGFSESVCEVFDEMQGDLAVACDNVEHLFNHVFPYRTYGVQVDSVEPMTRDPKDGTKLRVHYVLPLEHRAKPLDSRAELRRYTSGQ